jgi:5-(hydroxymethyl)furfural/furfural oxidase
MPAVRFNLLSDPRDLERMVSAFQLALRTMAAARDAGLVQQIFLPTAGAMIRELNRPRLRSRVKAAVLAALLGANAATRRWALQRAGLDPMPALQDPQRERELVQRFAGPVGHVCGTCRMGTAADPLAVTDDQGRVRGVAGLRVADASLMPTIVSANTNLATTMIAEKVADAIRRTGDTA